MLGIWYDARDPYETMVHFNLVMTDLNVEYTPYKAAETFGVPPQKEWDEIYAVLAKMHVKYWNDPNLRKPPFMQDTTGVFKPSPVEEMMSTTAGTRVELWRAAFNTHMAKNITDSAEMMAVQDMWKGDNCAKLYNAAIKHLNDGPLTLLHGDMNPGDCHAYSFYRSKLTPS